MSEGDELLPALTAQDAMARALAVLAASGYGPAYDAERAGVLDRGTEWFVRFPRVEPMRPNFGLVAVIKATGAARWVPLR